MHIASPDEHPGRCRNQRIVFVAGSPESLRCLDYEATEHVCSFPEPKYQATYGFSYTTTSVEPKPWVKPNDTGRSRPEGHHPLCSSGDVLPCGCESWPPFDSGRSEP